MTRASDRSKTTTLQQTPRQALDSYLAIMLEEATMAEEDVPEPTVADLAPETEAPPEPAAEPAPGPFEPVPVEPEPVDVPVATESEPESRQAKAEPPAADKSDSGEPVLAEAQLADAEQVLAWQDNGRPAWAAQRFDCLLFKVDGLALAVPMVLLGTIHSIDRELTPLFGQPDWFLGLLPVSAERNIRVIETARLVMPERYRPEAAAELKYAVGIHGCDWALSCHEVVGSITLEPGDVKWRSERTRRPWLAGTVVERMCALIDLEAFEKVLLSDKSI